MKNLSILFTGLILLVLFGGPGYAMEDNPETPAWNRSSTTVTTVADNITENLSYAVQEWDYEYLVDHAGDSFVNSIGKSFFLILFVLPFGLMYVQQRSMTMPTVLILILGVVLIGMLPEVYKTVALAAVAASIGYNLYMVARGREN